MRKTTNTILIVLGVFVALFVISMIVVFCIYQTVPDSLIYGVLGSGGTECILCAIIKVAKIKVRVGDITGFDDAEVIELEDEETGEDNE